MNFNDKLEKFENSQGGAVAELEEQPKSESETVVDQEAVTSTPEAEKPAAEEVKTPEPAKEETQVQQFDPNKFLEESSEGVFKSVDDLKANLTKVKEYDELKKQRDEFEAKTKEDPFANPLAKKFNDLLKAGKTQEQIDSFFRINQLGDLTQLKPFDIKVESLIQDGYKRDAAERKVTREFGLNIETEGEHLTPEEIQENKLRLEDAQEDLRVSAQADLAKLQDLKVKLEDTTNNNADNQALAQVAQLKEYNEKLKPTVANIAKEYTGIGSLNVNGKTGEEAKLMTFEADPEYKAQAEEKLFEYFKDGRIPVNAQTVAEAKSYLDAVWIANNKEKFAQINYNQGVADAKAAVVNEFENKSGLPTSGLPPVKMGDADSVREQQRKVARGEDD